MSAISLRGVCKRFGPVPVLVDLDLTVADGSITAVLGSSGSGKTTMLRLIAGFDQLDAGTIAVGGRIVDDGRVNVSPQRRGVGYVPQDGALFPHLTVLANVAFGLHRGDRARAHELLERVGLQGLARRYPHQLSGGEQQRVALARALAIRPDVVLLDEPFNALDASLRTEIGRDVIEILAQSATTTILVTHDQSEALALADAVAVLADGQIAALDDPRTLYRRPVDVAAATSIGEANILVAEFDGERCRCVLGTVALSAPLPTSSNGTHRLLVRPEQLALRTQPGAQSVPATIDRLYYQGHDSLAYLKLDDPGTQGLLARIPGAANATVGQRVWVEVLGPGVAVAVDHLTAPAADPPEQSAH